VETENVPKKKSILKKLCEKSSPTSDKGHEDVVDDDFDFEFRADGRISAGDVQKSKGGASNSESGFGGASHIGTQNVDVSVAANNKGQCSSCFTVTTTGECIVDLLVDVIVSSDGSTLHGGGLVAQIVAKRGGNLLEVYKDCIRKMCPSIQHWTFQPTPAVEKLKSKHVFHAVVAPFTNHNKTKWTDGFFV
jgi:hypothetical protein